MGWCVTVSGKKRSGSLAILYCNLNIAIVTGNSAGWNVKTGIYSDFEGFIGLICLNRYDHQGHCKTEMEETWSVL